MSNAPTDPLREKFRPESDPDLDRQINDALGGLSVEQIYGFDKPEPERDSAAAAAGGHQPAGDHSMAAAAADLARHGIRRGRVVAIRKGDVLVDLGGKSQGVVS